MRRAAIVGLLAGCNQIFGLDKTSVRDGATEDAPVAVAHLRWLVATTDAQLLPRPVELVPITPAPAVRVGPVGGVAMPATIAADGAIGYTPGPDPWRLEYTLDGDIPREVQWNPPAGRGNLIVPLFGRHDRITPPPTGSGYQISPSNPPTNGTPVRLFTTGIWAQGTFLWTGPRDFPFAGATSLSGPLGTPEVAKGDAISLQGTSNESGCVVVAGAAHAQADLAAGTMTQVTPAWQTTRNANAQVSHDALATLEQRLQTALGPRQGTIQPSRFEYGRLPSLGMPAFTRPSTPQFLLPTPLMVPFANCDFLVLTSPGFVEPGELTGLPRGLHAQIVATRTPVGGPGLASGFQQLVISEGAFALDFSIKLAIAPIMLGTSDLAAAPDDESVTIAGAPTLTFALSPGAADYFDVTLHRLDGTTLVPLRIYTVTEPSVTLDPDELVDGSRYVLEIRSYSGFPDADAGDFATITAPLGAATIFTRTFVVAK